MTLSVALAAANVILSPAQWPGGQGVLVTSGTFTGATITLQYKLPDGTFFSTTVAVTAAGVSAAFTLPLGLIQLVLSGGTTTNLVCNALVIPTNLN